MQCGCPECHSVEFSTSERLIGISTLLVNGDGDIEWLDQVDVLWDTAVTEYIECMGCGWGSDVEEGVPLTSYLTPTIGEEDLPDED